MRRNCSKAASNRPGSTSKRPDFQSQGSGRYPLLGHQPAMQRRTHPGKPISLLQSSCRRNGTRAASVLRRKAENHMMDFDDLLCRWLECLQSEEDIRGRYQQQFQFILVDEYQDTNKIQSDLVDILAATHQNVMVVGDDSQSIYSWRGAHFANIFEFPKRYQEAKVYKIETNYRSTPEILHLANAIIGCNQHQFSKSLTRRVHPASHPCWSSPTTHMSKQCLLPKRR